MTGQEIARTLDAAILKPEMNRSETVEALEECLRYHVFTACVRPADVPLAQKVCAGSDTGVCVVLGFPHGSQLTASKVDEAKRYVDLGVSEIDMVINIGLVRSHDWAAVTAEIAALSAVTRPASTPLKVIFETCFLTPEEIRAATKCAIEGKADFVKTSTGFGTGGATDEAVQVMLDAADGRIKVKPSGGIRDQARALHLLKLGAHRLGVGYTACAALCKGTGSATGSY